MLLYELVKEHEVIIKYITSFMTNNHVDNNDLHQITDKITNNSEFISFVNNNKETIVEILSKKSINLDKIITKYTNKKGTPSWEFFIVPLFFAFKQIQYKQGLKKIWDFIVNYIEKKPNTYLQSVVTDFIEDLTIKAEELKNNHDKLDRFIKEYIDNIIHDRLAMNNTERLIRYVIANIIDPRDIINDKQNKGFIRGFNEKIFKQQVKRTIRNAYDFFVRDDIKKIILFNILDNDQDIDINKIRQQITEKIKTELEKRLLDPALQHFEVRGFEKLSQEEIQRIREMIREEIANYAELIGRRIKTVVTKKLNTMQKFGLTI